MPKQKPPTQKKKPRRALNPSQRRDELRVLLLSGWKTLPEIIERLGVSRATVFRCLKELSATDALESDLVDGHHAWRLPQGARQHPLRISTSEMIALAFVRNALGFVEGTGIKEDIDALTDRFAHALKTSDYAHWKNLERKFFDMNELAYDYSDKLDVVNDVITALLHEETLTLTRKGGANATIDPYTLILYKKGLYVLGRSHERNELRSYGLDKIDDAERHPGARFDYPAEFAPAKHTRGPWGMIRGPKEHVVVRFDAKVAPFVTRRKPHFTCRFEKVSDDGAIEMTVDPEGTEEMVSWILGFGQSAVVLESKELRARVVRELKGALARYEE
jgi:predicted DNA-binding transcriptional regulator YafY